MRIRKEIELIEAYEKDELDLPEIILMTRLLLERGWVWKMPAPYQELAKAWIEVGVLSDPQTVKEKGESYG